MQTALVRHLTRVVLALGIAVPLAASARPSRKSPHVEIVGRGVVATTPRPTTHKNGRKFLEFEITLSTAHPTTDQPAGADTHLVIDTIGRVRVVHDLSCGGEPVTLIQGDRIEIQGEYVHVPGNKDLIHFTHPADGSCESGSGGMHPGGYLRKLPPQPRPAAIIPDQPYTGAPAPASGRPYTAILAAKAAGASNAELLAKVEREKVRYTLTTPEIQNLRAAGVSEPVIEAMLRSGRSAVTPAPVTTSTPR